MFVARNYPIRLGYDHTGPAYSEADDLHKRAKREQRAHDDCRSDDGETCRDDLSRREAEILRRCRGNRMSTLRRGRRRGRGSSRRSRRSRMRKQIRK